MQPACKPVVGLFNGGIAVAHIRYKPNVYSLVYNRRVLDLEQRRY